MSPYQKLDLQHVKESGTVPVFIKPLINAGKVVSKVSILEREMQRLKSQSLMYGK